MTDRAATCTGRASATDGRSFFSAGTALGPVPLVPRAVKNRRRAPSAFSRTISRTTAVTVRHVTEYLTGQSANTSLIETRRDPCDTSAAATFSSCCRRLITADYPWKRHCWHAEGTLMTHRDVYSPSRFELAFSYRFSPPKQTVRSEEKLFV